MTQLNNKTLADIVSEHNSTADVFEKYNLDFCSGKLELDNCNLPEQTSRLYFSKISAVELCSLTISARVLLFN